MENSLKSIFTTKKSDFEAQLPVNPVSGLKQETQIESQKQLEKIAGDITQAFQFADNAGRHYSGNRL